MSPYEVDLWFRKMLVRYSKFFEAYDVVFYSTREETII